MRRICLLLLGMMALNELIEGVGPKTCPKEAKEVLRYKWGALPPNGFTTRMRQVTNIIVYYSHIRLPCFSSSDCIKLMKIIQRGNMKKYKIPDTLYNYFWAFDGSIYEGTGWFTTIPAKDKNGFDTLHICLVGHSTFTTAPTPYMLERFYFWLNCKINQGFLSPNYKIWFHENSEIFALAAVRRKYPEIYRRLNAGRPIVNYSFLIPIPNENKQRLKKFL